MALTIVWTPEARKGLLSTLQYLEQKWTIKEILQLEKNLHNSLLHISKFPLMYPATSQHKNVRKALIDKNNYIIYRINIKLQMIEILNFRSVKQKPLG